MKDTFFFIADQKFNITVSNLMKNSPELFIRSKRSYYIERFISKYGSNNKRKINYEKDYLAFNETFFLKNLYKCFIAIAFLKKSINFKTTQFLDIGSGAGVFSLALFESFEKDVLNINMIDNCQQQIKLLRGILKFYKFKARTGFFPDEFGAIEGVRLGSYWLCEQTASTLYDSLGTVRKEILGAGAIFIDYPENINHFLTKVGVEFETIKWSFKFRIPENTKKIINESDIKVHGVAIFKKQENNKQVF
jgi:hypothetical protein